MGSDFVAYLIVIVVFFSKRDLDSLTYKPKSNFYNEAHRSKLWAIKVAFAEVFLSTASSGVVKHRRIKIGLLLLRIGETD
jgi:hypothetical protein